MPVRLRFLKTGRLVVGATDIDPAAALEVRSTTGGLLLPRMSTAQKNAISTPPDGLMLYDLTLNKAQVREAGTWKNIA